MGVVTHVVETRYNKLSDEDRNLIRTSVMVLLRDIFAVQPQSSTIKNKLSVLLVRLLKWDYPERWPSFFADFLGMLDKGVEVIDVFLRVLNTIIQEVVIFEDGRDPDEVKHNSMIVRPRCCTRSNLQR